MTPDARLFEDPVTARLMARWFEASDRVFLVGSTPWEVDEALVEIGFPMGPYEMQDLIGVELCWAMQRGVFGPERAEVPLTPPMLELGKYGRKTGAGWYRYPGGGPKVDDPIVADLALEESYYAGITRTDYKPDEICLRVLLALVNTAAELLADGIEAARIDAAARDGLGFPEALRGPIAWAEAEGLAQVQTLMVALAEDDPLLAPHPLITAAAETGTPLSQG